MKIAVWSVLVIVVASLLFAACGFAKSGKATEDKPADDAADKQSLHQSNFVPSADIESEGFTFEVSAGDSVAGYYDKDQQYWVCSEEGQLFETSPNTYGDRKYSGLRVKGQEYGMGLVDENGIIVVLPIYYSITTSFINGFCCVSNEDGKYGLISEDGRIVLPLMYDDIWFEEITDGLIKVRKDTLQGYVNLQNEQVIPFTYESIEQAGDGMVWFMKEPQRWGCLNYNNEVVVQPELTNTAPFVDGRAKAQKADGEYYYIYTTGKVEKCK